MESGSLPNSVADEDVTAHVEELVEELLDCLHRGEPIPTDEEVRRRMDDKGPAAITAVARHLRSEDPACAAASLVLRALKEEGLALVLSLCRDESQPLTARLEAVAALGGFAKYNGSAEALAELRRLEVNGGHWAVKLWARMSIDRMTKQAMSLPDGTPADEHVAEVEDLPARLKQPGPGIGEDALQRWALSVGPAAVPAVVQRMRTDDPLCAAAAYLIVYFEDDGLDCLLRLVRDETQPLEARLGAVMGLDTYAKIRGSWEAFAELRRLETNREHETVGRWARSCIDGVSADAMKD